MKDMSEVNRLYNMCSANKSVLEIGCGTCNHLSRITSSFRIGIDSFFPDLKKGTYKNISVVLYDLSLGLTNLIKNKSVDCTLGFDIIEHFEKRKAINLIKECESVSRNLVAFFIPTGKHLQVPWDKNVNQLHKSTWNPRELIDLGYEVRYFPNWYRKGTVSAGTMFCTKEL